MVRMQATELLRKVEVAIFAVSSITKRRKNMDTYRIKSTIAAIILAVSWISPAFACSNQAKTVVYCGHHAGASHHAIPGRSLSYLRLIVKSADALGLSSKQRQAIGNLLIQAEIDAAKAHAKSELAVAAFKSKLYAGKATAKDVNVYSEKMGKLRAARLSAHLLASIDATSLLNDKQREKLSAMHRHEHGASCHFTEKQHDTHSWHGKLQ